MGKRSSFERSPKDFYPTPEDAVYPLLPFLTVGKSFIEPCAGDGRLIRHLEKFGMKCSYSCDIEPRAPGIEQKDVLWFGEELPACEMIITNPPWTRALLFPMIEKFRNKAPTWLLFDAGFMHNGTSKQYLKFCSRIVSVGRVSWMGNGTSSMDDCCWYEFGAEKTETRFIA